MNSKATPAPGVDAGKEKDPLIGKQLGDYRLSSLLANGGMARIYKAMDYKLQRPAAIKVLAHEETEQDDTLAKRFQREARAVAALEHENIISIYQFGDQDGVYFLAMKLVKGKDLSQELRRLKKSGRKMEVPRALHILSQVANALDFAHAANVVHRDIKPSNILLDEDDKATLTDFGLVMRPSVETTMGTAFGTPRYIAPEQAISSNKALPQSDIYALAIVLYEILTGETPFTGDTPMEIALSQISDPPPPPRSKEKSIPVAVEREILKALDKEPENRHRSALEFIRLVKAGYSQGETATEVSTAPSTNNSSDSRSMPAVKVSASSAAVSPASDTQPKAARGRSRMGLVAAVVLVLAILGVGAFLFLNRTSVAADGAAITLIYNDSNFTMLNGGTYVLQVSNLKFVRGDADNGGDDYSAERVSQHVLPSKACFRISLQGKQDNSPPQCSSIQSTEFLFNQSRFFWRKEAEDGSAISTFAILYKGDEVARCDTVARGGDHECRFSWPVPAPTQTPEG